ncbi:MAG: wax ester/triacylglycerol synthase family O-acyltransferase [Proteobacteria bacterium]|nr:wax ester/triacylglycerol synthase family O-acyltransferase [Pseudomonadota bacterium]
MPQLPGSDSIFLAMETDTIHSHIGGVLILDASDSEGFGVERVMDVLRERLPLAPRFTWKLKEVPFGLDRPYWVPDPDFDVARHVRRVALPSPGGLPELAELVGHLHGQKLDRSRPLWEVWFIEGLEDGRSALLMKTHHCLMDGVAGADLSRLICDVEPDPEQPARVALQEEGADEGVPADLEIALRGIARCMTAPSRLARYAGQALLRGGTLLGFLARGEKPQLALPAPRVSFNGSIGPRRAVAWSSVPLADVKAVKNELARGAFKPTVNDVVLELCGSALRRYLEMRGERPDGSLAASCPVSTREAGEKSGGNGTQANNQLANMVLSLATDLDDPVERLEQIHRNASRSKALTRALLSTPIAAMGDTLPPAVLGGVWQALMALPAESAPLPANLVVSNVQGPPIPLYHAGARVEAMYPISILATGQGLNITLVSYSGCVYFGVTVDPDLVPDPWLLARALPEALEELRKAVDQRGARADFDGA